MQRKKVAEGTHSYICSECGTWCNDTPLTYEYPDRHPHPKKVCLDILRARMARELELLGRGVRETYASIQKVERRTI